MKLYLGVDIGSVSTNVVAINENTEVIHNEYVRTNGQPLESVKAGLRKAKEHLKCSDSDIYGVGTHRQRPAPGRHFAWGGHY